ncbi:hypothetical protein J9253_01035 [Thiothrix litoralis]|jgi:hypothetical protein|uniref:Uncharacterized protein n=1 Tax=Thiothrix litoralis TaxID=2891210 RepID=A0ABX7WY74_9GAMM|nr:hypothetical protein [Thiothrix litoralis]QTR46574.1 hypothetical protein J9253_01035 [Thiothrix litoralis]
MSEPQLHSSIVALVSLASGIASKHPDMGLCQLDKLRQMGVPEAHICSVIEIARHIRDEAAQKLDVAFDAKCCAVEPAKPKMLNIAVKAEAASCCTPTASGQSCC